MESPEFRKPGYDRQGRSAGVHSPIIAPRDEQLEDDVRSLYPPPLTHLVLDAWRPPGREEPRALGARGLEQHPQRLPP